MRSNRRQPHLVPASTQTKATECGTANNVHANCAQSNMVSDDVRLAQLSVLGADNHSGSGDMLLCNPLHSVRKRSYGDCGINPFYLAGLFSLVQLGDIFT